MSGICGVVCLDGRPVAVDVARRMAGAAPHRGAGGERFDSARDGVLVQQWRRTTSAAGVRPAPQLVVVADARLDNAAELRRALLRSGHLDPAAGEGDEALLRSAYAAWGEQFPDRIVGDFAVVVWDRTRRRLLAARDPMGMRSLYLRREQTGRVLFATEAKQVLAVDGVPGAVDEGAVAADLVGDYGSGDRSFFSGIDLVAPGSTWVHDVERSWVRRSWEIDPDRRVDCRSLEECAEELRRVFVQAVADRLDPHVTTGILLSGGVDSGSVASVSGWLREREPERTAGLHAFSWAFHELPQCDERHISRQLVDHYEMASTDVTADDAGPLGCWPEHGPDADDPFLGAFQPVIEHTLELARQSGVQVLLGGDRGDLVVGSLGNGYLRLLRSGRLRELAAALREHHEVLGDPWPSLLSRQLAEPVVARLRRRALTEWTARATQRLRQPAEAAPPVPDWIRPSFLDRVGLAPPRPDTAAPPGLDPLRAERHDYVFTPMQMRGVAWSERTYARYGLEFADPFSDRRLVELAVALPPAALNRPTDFSKPLMREAVRGCMPEAVRQQVTKIVPTPLYYRSLRRRAGVVRHLLTSARMDERGWVDSAALRAHFEQWLSGGALRPEFWAALQTEAWLRRLDP